MTTIAQIKKIVKVHGFIDKMKALGFEVGPNGLWFYRIRSDFLDYINITVKSSGHWIAVPVTCMRIDILDHCDMNQFPKGFTKGRVPFYSGTYINEEYGIEIGHDPWYVKEESDVINTFNKLYDLVLKTADPWLTNIDSNEKLYESWTVSFKESENAQRLKSILFGSV